MTKILIHGIKGSMGQFVYEQLKDFDVQVVGYDKERCEEDYIYNSFELIREVDVIIDFSHHTLVDPLISYASSNKIPTVICTTGLSPATEATIEKIQAIIPIFKSGNMSLGINVLLELAKLGAKSLHGFDIEIIEKHHKLKVDAPSGTAYMIADKIKEARSELKIINGREGQQTKRSETELGIHAIRGGSITGEHTVLFAGLDEVIELKHQATSKAVFAKGAIEAAFYLIKQQPGLYNMTDLILGGQR